MSVQDDAVAAAKAEYPQRFSDTVSEGPILMALDAGNRMSRAPYAQGYQAGHAAALAATVAFARNVKRRPEIDEPGCCETCRGSGRVAYGPWGSRPPTKMCEDCDGSGWSQ